jgi:hypothetical protein
MNVGDSILDHVQEAIRTAGALLIVLSKSSVTSSWCKKELNAGLIRELDEKRVVVLPVLFEDCEIPLFLKDKKYADFRGDFDTGLKDVLEAIAKVTNDSQSRIHHEEYHADWAIDWGDYDKDLFSIRYTIVEQVIRLPYTILTEVTVYCNRSATDRYRQYEKAGFDYWGRFVITKMVIEFAEHKEDFYVLLEDQIPVRNSIKLKDYKSDKTFDVKISCRRLGEDTGKDILIDMGKYLIDIGKYIEQVTKKPTEEEMARIMQIARN